MYRLRVPALRPSCFAACRVEKMTIRQQVLPIVADLSSRLFRRPTIAGARHRQRHRKQWPIDRAGSTRTQPASRRIPSYFLKSALGGNKCLTFAINDKRSPRSA
jgi:hypothetical protein